MSSNRTSWSFFQSTKPLTTRLYDNFIWAYEHSPINFSSFTGLHHPDVCRLRGNILLGRINQASADGGERLLTEIEKLAEVAAKDKRGIAYCSYAYNPVMLITQPAQIEQVAIHNDANTDRDILLMPFSHIFGKENLFSMNIGPEWRNKRNKLKDWIFNEKALDGLSEVMQAIIDEHLEHLTKNQTDSKEGIIKIPSVEKFMVSLAMDLFTRSVLNTKSLRDDVEYISKGLGSAISASSNPYNVALIKLNALTEYLHLKMTSPLDKERINLEQIIQETFLKPNKETLQKTANFLQHHFLEHKNDKDTFTAAYEDAAGLLLAGHETTSRLLQFTLMHLAKNPSIVSRLREEIKCHKPENDKWTRDDLDKMSYLKKVLKESLRLNPPVPIIPRIAKQSFIIADIPRCTSRTDYEKALQKRDVTKDIVVAKDTIIFISPWVTHRLESVYKNPLEFNPDRFESDELLTKYHKEVKDDKHDPTAWFPFGLGRRDCPGRKIALQESMLALIKMIETYDFSIDVVNKSDEYLKMYAQGTLKHKGEVFATLKIREQEEKPSLSLR